MPLLLIAIAIAEAEEGAIGNGAALRLVLEEIGYGCIGGVVAGLAATAVVRVGVPRRLVDEIWLQVVPVAGAALAYGPAVWMGRQPVYRRLRRRCRLRRFASRGRGRGDTLPRRDGGLLGAAMFGAATFILYGAVRLVPMLDDFSAEVVLSVLLQGLTATPLAGRYAAWFAAHPRDAAPAFESAPAPEQRPHRWAAGLWHKHRDVEVASSETTS